MFCYMFVRGESVCLRIKLIAVEATLALVVVELNMFIKAKHDHSRN